MTAPANRCVFTTRAFGIWCIACALTMTAAGISFSHFDVPAATFFARDAEHLEHLATGLAGTILVAGETLVVLSLVLLRLIRGRLSPLAHVLVVACITSICAYALDSIVLKVLFGEPNPNAVLGGARHAFDFMHGTRNSSFPSGHMMLAAGFGGVFIYCYPKSRYILSLLLIFGMCLLVAGNWHFISDVLTGTFLGITAGLLAGEIWTLHCAGSGRSAAE